MDKPEQHRAMMDSSPSAKSEATEDDAQQLPSPAAPADAAGLFDLSDLAAISTPAQQGKAAACADDLLASFDACSSTPGVPSPTVPSPAKFDASLLDLATIEPAGPDLSMFDNFKIF